MECSMCNIGDVVEKWSVGVSMLANPRIHPSLPTNFFLVVEFFFYWKCVFGFCACKTVENVAAVEEEKVGIQL